KRRMAQRKGALQPPLYYPKAQMRQASDRDSARPMISLQTSYRFDNCHCAGHAKDSDEQQVALHRRETTTKRSQCREHDQLPHPRVHLQDTFHFAPILEAPRPANAGQRDGPRLATTHPPSPRAPWPKTTLSKKCGLLMMKLHSPLPHFI